MKIVPGALDDDRLVAHRGDVGAARGAGSHHDGDLRDVPRGEARLVEEDAPEVLAVGEDVGLQGQECSARVDEVDARQVVLLGDLLRAQVLLDGQREVRAALHRGVVRDDHAAAALDHPDPRHDAGRRRLAVVDLPGGESVQLEEGRAGVDEQVDALTRRELAARPMALRRALAAARGDERGALPQLREQPLHVGSPRCEGVRGAIDPARQHRHRVRRPWRRVAAITSARDREDERKSLHAELLGLWAREGTRRRRQTGPWQGGERASGGPVCGGPSRHHSARQKVWSARFRPLAHRANTPQWASLPVSLPTSEASKPLLVRRFGSRHRGKAQPDWTNVGSCTRIARDTKQEE